MTNPPKAVEPRTLTRRRMLELGATGLGATGLAAFVAPDASASASGDQAPGSGQGQQPPKPPAPEAIVDIAAAYTEDWCEPWIWRPTDWPGQPLVLNLVGNPNPPRAVSPGNRFTPLYSFNGASPGPTIRMRATDPLRSRCAITCRRISAKSRSDPRPIRSNRNRPCWKRRCAR